MKCYRAGHANLTVNGCGRLEANHVISWDRPDPVPVAGRSELSVLNSASLDLQKLRKIIISRSSVYGIATRRVPSSNNSTSDSCIGSLLGSEHHQHIHSEHHLIAFIVNMTHLIHSEYQLIAFSVNLTLRHYFNYDFMYSKHHLILFTANITLIQSK
ncbi:hypothetical protein PoB_003206400 [Plakobranchus ocellatus]|uniref:HNH nuclease domain-containing protein n=1 Tax=Plakobranchus ocellatus TaxID=259542 RepID=A0AAV4AGK8_9GAST|nr:hypothetical protein PoB_003206400 [Plakobranchus ocellatus]